MLMVIFTFRPHPERREEYLGLARQLRPEVERIDGFLENDRFESRREPGRLLSLSTWRDEAALIAWRRHALHREAQARGRAEIFADYRLRVGELTSEAADGAGRAATVTEVEAGSPVPAESLAVAGGGAVDQELFESIYTPGRLAMLATWREMEPALLWMRRAPAGPGLRTRLVRIIRDYGPAERGEAPA